MNHAESSAWRPAIQAVILPFFLSRLWCAIFVYLGHAKHPYLSPVIGGWQGVENWWLNPWTAFDSRHFLDIAARGYDSHTAAFFPLYPLLLRVAGGNIHAMALWGIFLSNLAFASALVGLFRLTELEKNSKTARLAVWLLAFCPTTIYFSAVYSESLFLFFFVLTFWFVRQNRWAPAALCTFLAALTRQVGVLLFLALLIEWHQAKNRGDQNLRFAPVATFAPFAALALWQFIIAIQVNDITRGLASQQEYLRAPTWPWTPVLRDLASLDFSVADPVLWLHLIVTFLAFFFLATRWKRQPVSYTAMIFGVMMMNFSLSRTEVPYTLPIARYLMTMFPFVQQIAVGANEIKLTRPTRYLMAVIYSAACAFFSYRFGLKDFIS